MFFSQHLAESGGLRSDESRDILRNGGAVIWENIHYPFAVRRIAEHLIYHPNIVPSQANVSRVQSTVQAPLPSDQHNTQTAAYQAPAPYRAPPVTSAQIPAMRSAEQKLNEINDLKKKGLITDTEYEQKRKEILNNM